MTRDRPGDASESGSPASASSLTHDDAQTVVMGNGPVPDPTHVALQELSRGRYIVLEELGRGGMGRVLRAYDPKLQREVALKEVRRAKLGAEDTRRLIVEARAMAKLSHSNVVAVFDVEEVGPERVVLVMEYVDGQTLSHWLGEKPRPWPAVIERFVAAGRALAAAHAAGLLHRDFKPANVLVSTSGLVKVTDFGLAKLDARLSQSTDLELDSPLLDGDGGDDDLTGAGVVLGTPRYMAPEQHAGHELGPAVDQYAFCVALWEALTGTPPFAGENLARRKAQGPPDWPGGSTLRATPSRPIVDAIVRGLSPRPDERWLSMDALLQALAFDPVRRRRRIMLGLGVVSLLVASIVANRFLGRTRLDPCGGSEARVDEIWGRRRRSRHPRHPIGLRSHGVGAHGPRARRLRRPLGSDARRDL